MFGFGRLKEKRQLKRAKKEEQNNARTQTRTKNGGAGSSVTFHEVEMPDGRRKHVRRVDSGNAGTKKTDKKLKGKSKRR